MPGDEPEHMSAFSDLLESDRDNVFLNEDEFGESVTRYAQGDTSSGTTFTAIVHLDDEPAKDADRGHGRTIRGTVEVPDTQALDRDDVLRIRSHPFKVEEVALPENGWKLATVVRRDRTTDTGPNRTRTGR